MALIPERSSTNRRQVLAPIREFLRICESNKGRMHVIVDRMRRICREKRQRRNVPTTDGSIRGLYLSPFALGFVYVSMPASKTSSVSNGADYKQDKMAEKETEDELVELTAEFMQLFRPLKKILQAVKRSYQVLGRDTENLMRLEIRIEDLFTTSNMLLAECPLVVTQKCERALTELEDLLTAEDLVSLLWES